MANWRQTANIKPFLTDGLWGADPVPAATRRGICDTLNTLPAGLRDHSYRYIGSLADMIEDLADEGTTPDCDSFNDVLEQVYNWADDNRVWLGL